MSLIVYIILLSSFFLSRHYTEEKPPLGNKVTRALGCSLGHGRCVHLCYFLNVGVTSYNLGDTYLEREFPSLRATFGWMEAGSFPDASEG